MGTSALASPATERSGPEPGRAWFVEHSPRLALIAFAAYLVVAFALLLGHFGTGFWFFGDDWGMFDGRSIGSVDDLLRPQNGHWSTVPVVIYQVLYRVVGLRSYAPYMATTILLHLTLVVLLRLVMRRAGVGPWMATFVASTFVLFGAGYENILLAIQISMMGSMVFGVAQLLLADHDGPADRRDLIGLGFGLLALMASSIGLATVVAVGAAVLIRRGWRMALLQTAPLGAVYLTWFVWLRVVGEPATDSGVGSGGPIVLAKWVLASAAGVFTSLGQNGIVAVAIAILLVGGLALAWLPLDRATFRRSAAAPIGLIVGALALAVLIGSQRGGNAGPNVFDAARASRYTAMATALTLPALGVAAAAVVRRWRVAAPVVVVVLVLGVPGNLAAFDGTSPKYLKAMSEPTQRFIVGVAESPVAGEVPGDVYPHPHEFSTSNLTVGFVLQAERRGRLPDIELPSEAARQQIDTRLRLAQSLAGSPVPEATCTVSTVPIQVTAQRGQQFVLGSALAIALPLPSGALGAPTPYSSAWSGKTLTSQFDDLVFEVRPDVGTSSFTWCTVS